MSTRVPTIGRNMYPEEDSASDGSSSGKTSDSSNSGNSYDSYSAYSAFSDASKETNDTSPTSLITTENDNTPIMRQPSAYYNSTTNFYEDIYDIIDKINKSPDKKKDDIMAELVAEYNNKIKELDMNKLFEYIDTINDGKIQDKKTFFGKKKNIYNNNPIYNEIRCSILHNIRSILANSGIGQDNPEINESILIKKYTTIYNLLNKKNCLETWQTTEFHPKKLSYTKYRGGKTKKRLKKRPKTGTKKRQRHHKKPQKNKITKHPQYNFSA